MEFHLPAGIQRNIFCQDLNRIGRLDGAVKQQRTFCRDNHSFAIVITVEISFRTIEQKTDNSANIIATQNKNIFTSCSF
jgi:hypothetical protein